VLLFLVRRLLAALPVLALPLLVGGVAPADFGRTVLVALNNLFLSLAVGMFCSSVCRDERRSMNLAMLFLLVLTAGLPLVGSMLVSQARALDPYYPLFVMLSPGFDAIMAFQSAAADFNRQYPGWPHFELSLALLHALGWLLLGAACWIVPRTWQDRPLSSAALARRRRLAEVDHGAGEERVSSRRHLLDLNPVLWLTGRHRLKGLLTWALLGALLLIWILSAAYMDWKNLDEFLTIVLLLAAHSALKVWLASEAGQQFSQDRASGALELLLSTPLSVPEIVRGQMLALQRQFLFPALVVLGLDALLALALLPKGDAGLYWGAAMLIFAADMLALVPVGMWQGLNSRRANAGASAAVAQILVLPWAIFLLSMVFLATAGVRGAFGSADWALRYFPLLSWIGISLIVDLLFGMHAWRQLNERFRELATTRFQTKGKRG